MTSRIRYLLFATSIIFFTAITGAATDWPGHRDPIITGADQTHLYVPYLKGKRVGMLINQTSLIGNKLSVDSLLSLGVDIKTIFGPEHGFRGNASNGAVVHDEIDAKTGL